MTSKILQRLQWIFVSSCYSSIPPLPWIFELWRHISLSRAPYPPCQKTSSWIPILCMFVLVSENVRKFGILQVFRVLSCNFRDSHTCYTQKLSFYRISTAAHSVSKFVVVFRKNSHCVKIFVTFIFGDKSHTFVFCCNSIWENEFCVLNSVRKLTLFSVFAVDCAFSL